MPGSYFSRRVHALSCSVKLRVEFAETDRSNQGSLILPAPFLASCLGVRSDGRPNTCDKDSRASVLIAGAILEALGLENALVQQDSGTALESEVERYLQTELRRLDPNRTWVVQRKAVISDYTQYGHLARVQELISSDPTGTLEIEVGGDYLIKPDVTVGLRIPECTLPFLHAAVSCKWTIRSDRVQNVRHEAVILTRHRRGRQPHIVTVTAEPLPTRIAAIARGTGEVDGVYQICLPQLRAATHDHASAEQNEVLARLVEQGRLFDFDRLAATLVL